jgi:hypothetical protein
MRVLIAVLALVATPVIASVAQDRGSTPPASGENRGVRHSDARSGDKDADTEECENDKENSHRWQEGLHKGDKKDDKQCGSSGTGGTGGTGSVGTTGSITGMVFYGTAWSPTAAGVLSGTIQLTGGPVTVSKPAELSGNFSFTGLAAGTYTVCAVPSSFFHQMLPLNNGCYTVTLGGTQWAAGPLYFGVM